VAGKGLDQQVGGINRGQQEQKRTVKGKAVPVL